MYTLSSWRRHLGIVAVDLLHQETARTLEDPFTAYVPEEVTRVSRITNVNLSFWRSHLRSVGVDFLYKEPARTVRESFTACFPGEVTQVTRMVNVHPKFLEKSPRKRGSRLFVPGTR